MCSSWALNLPSNLVHVFLTLLLQVSELSVSTHPGCPSHALCTVFALLAAVMWLEMNRCSQQVALNVLSCFFSTFSPKFPSWLLCLSGYIYIQLFQLLCQRLPNNDFKNLSQLFICLNDYSVFFSILDIYPPPTDLHWSIYSHVQRKFYTMLPVGQFLF